MYNYNAYILYTPFIIELRTENSGAKNYLWNSSLLSCLTKDRPKTLGMQSSIKNQLSEKIFQPCNGWPGKYKNVNLACNLAEIYLKIHKYKKVCFNSNK